MRPQTEKEEAKTVRGAIMLDPDRARRMILERVRRMGVERAGVANALGRVLAEAVVAEHDVPRWSTATRDGYAARSADTGGATEKTPRMLSVLSEHTTPTAQLPPGTTVPVHARDPLPLGADTVIEPSGCYRPTNDPQVAVLAECQPGANLRPAGQILSKGEPVVAEGTLVTSREMGLIALVGKQGVKVARKPRVSLLTTGQAPAVEADNLGGDDETGSARFYLIGAVLEAGCEIGAVNHTRDGRMGIQKALAQLSGSDAVIVVTGPGDGHEASVSAIRNVGEIVVERLNTRPASSSAFGLVGEIPVFVVPAECALEAFEVLVRPSLLNMVGRSDIDRPRVNTRVLSVLRLNPGCRHYVKAITSFGEDGYSSRPLVSALANARPWTPPDSLLIVRENTDGARRGDILEAMLLR